MDGKRIGALLRRAADEVPELDPAQIMQSIRSRQEVRRRVARSAAVLAVTVALLLVFNTAPDVTSPPVAPEAPLPEYMVVVPDHSPYPDPLTYGYMIQMSLSQ